MGYTWNVSRKDLHSGKTFTLQVETLDRDPKRANLKVQYILDDAGITFTSTVDIVCVSRPKDTVPVTRRTLHLND